MKMRSSSSETRGSSRGSSWALRLLAEQTLPWADVAGLCADQVRLLALSDRGRTLIRLESGRDDWRVAETWRTPADDLEGLAVLGEQLFLAQDSGGLWRASWPP